MCGILGIVGENSIQESEFLIMLKELKSRGPDGYHAKNFGVDTAMLGHARLSIIDLTENATQPMSNEDDSLWLTFNGEIYNFYELRIQLEKLGHVFKSKSDSEVILHAYEEWGVECLNRLNGIFAFGIWDNRLKKLFLARDHVGVKPLYYSNTDQSIQFASQVKSLIKAPGFIKKVDIDSLSEYFSYGYVGYDKSIFEGIHKLPPAHYLIWEENKPLILKKFWQLEYNPIITDYKLAVKAIRDQLELSIKSQMVSDVPLGVFLSGGIDSSIVTSVAKQNSTKDLCSFTIGFDIASKDERIFAKIAADEFSTLHFEKILSQSFLNLLISKFSDIYDEPFYDSSGLATFFVSDFARENGMKVILAGDGGDELFAGYTRYFSSEANTSGRYTKIKLLLKDFLMNGSKNIYDIEEYYELVGFMDLNKRNRLLMRDDLNSNTFLLDKFYNPEFGNISSLQYVDFHTYLVEDILTKVDRASMYCGIEARVPFLDRKLVELAFQIKGDLHSQNGERKSILKAAARDLLPQSLMTTRKKGFSVPMANWMKDGLRSSAEKLILRGSLINRKIISESVAIEILKEGNFHEIWLLLSAELWSKRWLDDYEVDDIYKLLAGKN
jgi:asparagine synthase (glutamine-hydrolysing)